jgi:DNA modification methylase
MPEGKPVKLTPAKGRPMLNWVGKQPLDRVVAFPAQLVERFDPSAQGSAQEFPAYQHWQDHPQGLLFYGDNKDVLACLLANGYRGKVNLVYIDPPFDSGADYVRRVELRGVKSTKIEGENYSLGEQIQYTDIWTNDNYLQFIYERLMLLKELLSDDGSIYLHSDSHRTHHLRCLLDEVFGPENFKNDIVWKRFNYRADGLKFGTVHDTILFYTKSNKYNFEKPYIQFKPSYIRSHFKPDENGRLFRLDNLTAPSHGKPGKPLRFGNQMIPPPAGTMWRHAQEGIDELWKKGLIVLSNGGTPQVKRYLDEIEGQAVHSIWTDISSINSQANERSDYPTQKPEELLERIVDTSSNPGDIILDCFVGSGSTAAVAQKLGRRWIAADINKGAIQTTSKRLQSIIRQQLAAPSQLPGMQAEDAPPPPAQLSFSLYRVNDYDLQIQHNEAVNLAMQHVGVERLKGDSFFDGTLGRRLVKIITLQHPLTLLDLQLIQDELKTRSSEARDITVVCLGKETAVDPYLKDYNRKHPINKIEVIELRTDPRYGKFFTHQPAGAEVEITRQGDKVIVEIHDFISPTILERLEMDSGIFKAKITDWRSMVDTILIDNHYDGEMFNIVLSDVPERKNDLVAGRYELPAPSNPTVVAVKIIEMLGEEVIVTKEI